MTHSQLHASIAFASTLVVAAAVAILPSVPPASAESQADRICDSQGIRSSSAGYEFCVSQATRAIEWGKPEIAYTMARATAEARDACIGKGLQPTTIDYRACIERETYARSLLVQPDEPRYDSQIASP